MINFKKIFYIISTICVLQRFMFLVEGAVIADASNSAAESDYKTLGSSSGTLDSIYHKSRQLRCVTCYDDRRYGDDRSRYYSSYSARSGDDRTSGWYYPSYDRYDDRGYRGSEYDRYGSSGSDRYGGDRYASADRYGTERYGADRYGTVDRYAGYRDDQYSSRPLYDRYESRPRIPHERLPAYDRGESRGYGYDNRDRDYYVRDRYYERPRYGATAGVGSSRGYGAYDRDYYDRYSTRYDYRHYRPWHDTYRSQAGYYFAKPQEDRRYLPDSGYSSPCGLRRPNCPHEAPEDGAVVTSGTIDSGHYNVGVSQTNYHTNSNTNQNDSSKGSGSPAGWSYMREDDQPSRDGSSSGGSFASKNNNNNNNNHRDRNIDQQSSGYGALLDRGTNLIAVEPIKPDGSASDTQENANTGDNTKQLDNGQNS